MSGLPPLNRHGQIKTAKTYAKVIHQLRAKAREFGYSLSVHGSLKRDIDLIACPWIDDAAAPQQLADALREETESICGFSPYGCDGPFPRPKPHGRLCWTIHIDGTYIDLSVMPCLSDSK